ncbi:iron-sulfur cluster biosynthesis family protein [Paenibacillus sp. NEAU-GSW1]|nr:iron-sulfur cluster biosynthesis family protein [Paenibacillus sp. NEAU-GSW1]
MHISFSKAAVAYLSPYLSSGEKQLKLLHDTEGCGCVMSGVPALQLVQESTVDDRMAEGDPFPFLYEPRHEVFFEPELRIDYSSDRNAFSLKSDSQIYTLNLRFIKS